METEDALRNTFRAIESRREAVGLQSPNVNAINLASNRASAELAARTMLGEADVFAQDLAGQAFNKGMSNEQLYKFLLGID